MTLIYQINPCEFYRTDLYYNLERITECEICRYHQFLLVVTSHLGNFQAFLYHYRLNFYSLHQKDYIDQQNDVRRCSNFGPILFHPSFRRNLNGKKLFFSREKCVNSFFHTVKCYSCIKIFNFSLTVAAA